MSPFSLLKHSIPRSTPRVVEFFDFRDMHRIDWRLALKATRNQPAIVKPEARVNADAPPVILRRGQVVFAMPSQSESEDAF